MTQPTSGVEHGDGVQPSETAETAGAPENATAAENVEPAEHADSQAHAEQADLEEHESHGHSAAAWTAVVIILVGSLVMALAVVFPSVTLFIVGAIVAVLGIAAGKILAMAGYGDKASTYQAAHRASGHTELPGRTQTDSGTQ